MPDASFGCIPSKLLHDSSVTFVRCIGSTMCIAALTLCCGRRLLYSSSSNGSMRTLTMHSPIYRYPGCCKAAMAASRVLYTGCSSTNSSMHQCLTMHQLTMHSPVYRRLPSSPTWMPQVPLHLPCSQVAVKQQKLAYGAELQAQMAAGDAAKRRDKMDRMGINPQPQQQQPQQQGELHGLHSGQWVHGHQPPATATCKVGCKLVMHDRLGSPASAAVGFSVAHSE